MNRSAFGFSLSLVVFGLAAHVGCSSDETVSKAPSADSGARADTGSSTPVDSGSKPADSGGGTDSSTIVVDSGPSTACADYCACMDTTCASVKPANCVAACAAATTWDVPCRTQHCGYAKAGDTATHCPHASGANTCN